MIYVLLPTQNHLAQLGLHTNSQTFPRATTNQTKGTVKVAAHET